MYGSCGQELLFVPKNIINLLLCKEAIKNYSYALQYIPKELLDETLRIEVVEKYGEHL